ncbi:hypothetical protein QIH80_28405 [Bradyrhizobium elkanii]|nr:hypothetical protein QIH80_28405 [Bradyrhizobium elkanii]
MTIPPFWIVSVPVPASPTNSAKLLVQDEPEPVTVAVPFEPARKPMSLPIMLATAPFRMVSVPVPPPPTLRMPPWVQDEPGPSIVTVPFEPAMTPIPAIPRVALGALVTVAPF